MGRAIRKHSSFRVETCGTGWMPLNTILGPFSASAPASPAVYTLIAIGLGSLTTTEPDYLLSKLS
jgi:hypothetical protein